MNGLWNTTAEAHCAGETSGGSAAAVPDCGGSFVAHRLPTALPIAGMLPDLNDSGVM